MLEWACMKHHPYTGMSAEIPCRHYVHAPVGAICNVAAVVGPNIRAAGMPVTWRLRSRRRRPQINSETEDIVHVQVIPPDTVYHVFVERVGSEPLRQ